MESLSVYHGAISKDTTERLLGGIGRDGSFLIRDSESKAGVYCLCVLYKTNVFTYRLYQDKEAFWVLETSPDVQPRCFRHVKNLIAAFQKPNQGIAMTLLYPVTRDDYKMMLV